MDIRTRILIPVLLLASYACCWAIAEPQPEGAMGTFPVPPIVAMAGEDVFLSKVTIKEAKNWDPSGILFFQLFFPDGTSAVLTIDADLAFAKALQAAEGRPQRLILEPYERRLER